MAVFKRAALPLLFSIVTGITVPVAIGYVYQQVAEPKPVLALGFAVGVFLIWLVGFVRTWIFLSQYNSEEANLEQTQSGLEQMAERFNANGAISLPDLRTTPLLNRRIRDMLPALRRGALPASSDMADGEERRLSGPERELRMYMDIALNIGIAGTFVSILVTLAQTRAQGLDANTLLTHAGPGMTSGLAAVIANIGLRLCHRALQDEQDDLAQKVDDTLADSLLANIHRNAISPEDRLAEATKNTLETQNKETQAILDEQNKETQDILDKQNAKMQQALIGQYRSTQETLAAQNRQFDALLKVYAENIKTILTEQVQQPVEQIAKHAEQLAKHAGKLARHSGAWAETASGLKQAHVEFLQAEVKARQEHEKRLGDQFTQYRDSLEDFFEAARKVNRDAAQETQDFTRQLLEMHSRALTAMLEHLRTQYAQAQAEQEATHRRLTEAALAALDGIAAAHLAGMEARIASVLDGVESRLPDAIRNGVRDGLAETVALVTEVRVEAGKLAHVIEQISGATDRQLQEYKKWQEVALSIQGRLEQVVTDGQAAQTTLLARWQSEAARMLENTRESFETTARDASRGYAALAAAFDPLSQTLLRLHAVTQELHGALSVLPSQLATTRETLADNGPPLRDVADACRAIPALLNSLSDLAAFVLNSARTAQENARLAEASAQTMQVRAQQQSVAQEAAQKHSQEAAQNLQALTQEAARDLQTLTQAVGGAVTSMDQAAQAFAVVAMRVPTLVSSSTPADGSAETGMTLTELLPRSMESKPTRKPI